VVGPDAVGENEGLETFQVRRHVRGGGTSVEVTYVPQTCNHCDDAPCVRVTSDGSVYKGPDGIVIVDPVKAKPESLRSRANLRSPAFKSSS
jgi:Fe-S-cluster-containing dehydrogenase component